MQIAARLKNAAAIPRLLLRYCVFMNSSPAQNIGVPFDTIRIVKKFLICRFRSNIISAGIPSSASHPQFQLKL